MCTNQDISNIPFNMKGNHFLVHGHKKDLPHITCIFHLSIHVVKFFCSVSHFNHISLLRLLPTSYFKMSTFQSNFLCSSSFKTEAACVLYKNQRCSRSFYYCDLLFMLSKLVSICIMQWYACRWYYGNVVAVYIKGKEVLSFDLKVNKL